MDAETLRIALTFMAAIGVSLGVRWYLIHGLAGEDRPANGDDWMA
ncbi:hypothetical protein [Pseudomonas boanensis]